MSVEVKNGVNKKYEMIQYPGIVKNMDKMMQTLGGVTKVSQALSGETKQLELCYHPENPFSKPLRGYCNPHRGLLLSIKVRRYKNKQSKPIFCNAKVLGYIDKSFSFDSLCDFQYLPLASECEGTKHSLKMVLSDITPKSLIDLDYFEQVNVPLMAIPTTFARSDVVHYGIFRGDFSEETGQNEVLGVCHKSTYENRNIVPFNMVDIFPTQPDAQLVKCMKIKYVSDQQFQKVKQLFEDCPIWTRIALLYESGITNDKLKCITPSMAYYFATGPWRKLFVRYGYDPRRDFQSRFYQTFDFRLRLRMGIAELVSDRRTSIKKQRQSDISYEMQSLVHDVDYPYFDENKLPRSRQCILRYCDVRIPKIQEMLEKIPSPLGGALCNERTGWLPVGFDAQVRQILSNSIKDLLRRHYRKEQFHAEIDSYDNTGPELEPIESETISDDDDGDDFMKDSYIEEILDDLEELDVIDETT